MKVVKLALTAAFAILLVIGCKNGLQDNNKNVSHVNVSLNGNFRAILPDLGIEGFSKIEISAESSNGGTIAPVAVNQSTGRGTLTVPYGDWDIIATAFLTVNGEDYPAVKNSVSLNVNQPEHSVTILLDTPVPGGEGTFAYNIEFSAGTEVYITLENWPLDTGLQIDNELVTASGQTFTENLPSGFYFLTVTAIVDNKIYPREQIVHIYHDRITTAEFSFVIEEIVAEIEGSYEDNDYNSLTSSVPYHIVNLPLENRENVMKIDGSTLAENEAHVALFWLTNHPVKITFSADVKRIGASGNIRWEISNSGEWPLLDEVYGEEGVWYSMSGTWTGIPTDNYPMFYISTHENNTNETIYYIDNFQIEVEVFGNPDDTVLVFQEALGWQENEGWARWNYSYEGINSEFEEPIKTGDIYAFHYTFTSNINIANDGFGLTLVDRFDGWTPLSDWTDWMINNTQAGTELSGTVILIANNDATDGSPEANTLVFSANKGDDQPIFIFTRFEFEKIDENDMPSSVDKWREFDITYPGIYTVAAVRPDFQGKDDVLHVKPGLSGHYYYDVISNKIGKNYPELLGKMVLITVTVDVFLEEEAKVTFEVNDSAAGWPAFIGSKETPFAAGVWHSLSGSHAITLQENNMVYVSGTQIVDSEAYFANLTISVVELIGDEESEINIVITDAFGSNSNIVLTSLDSVDLGDDFTAEILFNNTPNASIAYTWRINGATVGTTSSLTYPTSSLANTVNYGTVIVTINETPFTKAFEFRVK